MRRTGTASDGGAILPAVAPPDERRSQLIARLRRPAWLGTIRRTAPLSASWGRDRGTPIDRWFIERFLARHAGDIHGRVLEVLDSRYADAFGRDVSRVDVLDIDASNPRATVTADLAAAGALESGAYDCFILTQTLQYVYDVRAALGHAHRILRPGGTLLCTVPTVSRIEARCLEVEHWRFTAAACRRLLTEEFGDGRVDVRSHGNVLACASFLFGLAAEELKPRELETVDPYFPLLVTCRATKAP